MKDVTFVTGNKNKARYFSKLIGLDIPHQAIDVYEIQSLDLHEIVEFKLDEAYAQINRPVLVEDVSLEFTALGKLPGTFIKWFRKELSDEALCRLLDNKDRSATARCVMGYFDGTTKTYFEGALAGTIADEPAGNDGFGWDKIFIPEGYSVTRAELSPEDDEKTYKTLKSIDELRNFLLS